MAKQNKKNLNQLIEDEIEEELDKYPEKKSEQIRQEIDQDIEKIVEAEVEKRIEQRIQIPSQSMNASTNFVRPIIESIRTYWRQYQSILYIILIGYLTIILFMSICTFSDAEICTTREPLGAPIYLAWISVITLIVSLLFSFSRKDPRSAMFFSLLVDLPLLILIILLTARYIGLILIALVIFVRFIQGIRRY